MKMEETRCRFHTGMTRQGAQRGSDRTWGQLDLFVDTGGRLALPAMYDEALDFSEGFAAVKMHAMWGFIDLTGDLVIPAVYIAAESFKGGCARVWVNGYAPDESRCIDTKGSFREERSSSLLGGE